MLEWKEIKGYNHNFNYKANMEAGVDLPELNVFYFVKSVQLHMWIME